MQSAVTFRRFVAILRVLFAVCCLAQTVSAQRKGITPIDPPNAPAQRAGGVKRAVIIGVNDYGSRLPPLNYCVNDVVKVHAALQLLGSQQENMKLLHDDVRFDRLKPTRENIRRALQELVSFPQPAERGDPGKQAPADLVLVYFSGHGIHIDGTSYLCPADADSKRPNETLLSVQSVMDELARSPARQRVLFVDACRNLRGVAGQAENKFEINRFQAQGKQRNGLRVVSSCAAGETATEEDALRHGLFTYYLLRGLCGAGVSPDAAGRKTIRLDGLVRYIDESLKGYFRSEQDFGRGKRAQTPTVFGVRVGEVELGSLRDPLRHALCRQILAPPGKLTNHVGMRFIRIGPQRRPDGHAIPPELARTFYLGTAEVTRGQWNQFRGIERAVGPDELLPMTEVTWKDAVAFCDWLSRQTAERGRRYRLPSATEWEFACRAGSKAEFCFGNDVAKLSRYANYNPRRNPGIRPAAGAVIQLIPVASLRPNAWGFYDMHGSVLEWCLDAKGPGDGVDFKIVRGGSFKSTHDECRSDSQEQLHFRRADDRVGFRVLLEADSVEDITQTE